MTILILGGSSGLGRALARRFAAEHADLLIVARDQRDLERGAADARTRQGVQVSCIPGDVSRPDTLLPEISSALQQMAPLRGIICVAGGVDDTDEIKRPDLIAPLVAANFVGPSTIVAALAPRVVKGGFIVGVGSVAAARGRRRNSAYAAAKGALHLYFQSLRHALWRDVLVQFYIAGYLDTNLAFGRRVPLALASPEAFASHIARQIKLRKQGDFYFPAYWRYVTFAVARLPWAIFRQMDF